MWLMYGSWFLGPVLQITLLGLMVRRKLLATLPRFFSYIIFQLVKTGILFGLYHYNCATYFYAYWTGNALSIFLALAVMDEIWRNLFRPYAAIQSLGSLIFRWACVVLLLIVVITNTNQGTTADRVVSFVFSFDRTMRLMQCGLVLLLVLFCRFFKQIWRQYVFGIALGFGIFAAIELILVSILLRYGDGQRATISLVKSAAYNAITLLWIGYLRQRSPIILSAPQLDEWNVAIVQPWHARHSDPFITMVEQAAERVLSRSSWPKPLRQWRFASRKPGPEDCN